MSSLWRCMRGERDADEPPLHRRAASALKEYWASARGPDSSPSPYTEIGAGSARGGRLSQALRTACYCCCLRDREAEPAAGGEAGAAAQGDQPQG